jgi:hypothetical protein
MSDKELSKIGLPIVSEQTVEAFYAVGRADPVDYGRRLEEFKTKLLSDNQQLCRHIGAELNKYPADLQATIFGTVVSTLSIIEHQARADMLNSTIETPDDSSLSNS